MWPEVTIKARSKREANCLLYALEQARINSLRRGLTVQAGDADPARILNTVHDCLTDYGIDAVSVVLRDGREHILEALVPQERRANR